MCDIEIKPKGGMCFFETKSDTAIEWMIAQGESICDGGVLKKHLAELLSKIAVSGLTYEVRV